MRNLEISKGELVTIDVVKHFGSVVISGGDQEVPSGLRFEQADGKRMLRRDETGLATMPGNLVSLRPGDRDKLKKTPIMMEEILLPGNLRRNRKSYAND